MLEYQLDQIKIVDFLLLAKFRACPDNYGPPSSYKNQKRQSVTTNNTQSLSSITILQ